MIIHFMFVNKYSMMQTFWAVDIPIKFIDLREHNLVSGDVE